MKKLIGILLFLTGTVQCAQISPQEEMKLKNAQEKIIDHTLDKDLFEAVNSFGDDWGRTFPTEIKKIKKLFSGQTIPDVNARHAEAGWNGWTALIVAIERASNGLVKLLIKNKADVNLPDNNNVTPLMHASFRGYIDIVKLLIQQGADVNAVSHNGSTAMSEAISQDRYYQTQAPRLPFFDYDRHAKIIKILVADGAHIPQMRMTQEAVEAIQEGVRMHKKLSEQVTKQVSAQIFPKKQNTEIPEISNIITEYVLGPIPKSVPCIIESSCCTIM